MDKKCWIFCIKVLTFLCEFCIVFLVTRHGEMADARDLKSWDYQKLWGFKSPCRDHFSIKFNSNNLKWIDFD